MSRRPASCIAGLTIAFLAVLAAAPANSVGCGSSGFYAPVAGTVTLDGSADPTATVSCTIAVDNLEDFFMPGELTDGVLITAVVPGASPVSAAGKVHVGLTSALFPTVPDTVFAETQQTALSQDLTAERNFIGAPVDASSFDFVFELSYQGPASVVFDTLTVQFWAPPASSTVLGTIDLIDDVLKVRVPTVPVPAALPLLATGLGTLVLLRRRRR